MLPLQQFQDFAHEQQLFTKGDKILLAVSGGKDSVLMVHFFKQLGINIAVAHCNFNLRKEEAPRDENFVKSLCISLNVPFFVTHFNTKTYAATHKISTQMAARELRYNWFESLREKEGYDYIALAQHRNDAVETVLINLTRGTGISGLHGILPKRGRLIRPLLFLNSAEIGRLIAENQIDFVEDSSNLSTDYTRNKLRLKVVPVLKEINPNLEHTFAQNMEHFTEIESFLKDQVSLLTEKLFVRKEDAIYISLQHIAQLKPQKLLLFEMLKPFGFTYQVVGEMTEALNGISGKHFYSEGYQAIINRSDLIVVPLTKDQAKDQLIDPDDKNVSFGRNEILISYSETVNFESSGSKAFVDAGCLQYPLVLRTWKTGDKFVPLGMKNFKKLSDFFIDQKIPLHIKESVPLLVNGNGEIIWIAGMRQDNRYKLTQATKKVAIFELKLK